MPLALLSVSQMVELVVFQSDTKSHPGLDGTAAASRGCQPSLFDRRDSFRTIEANSNVVAAAGGGAAGHLAAGRRAAGLYGDAGRHLKDVRRDAGSPPPH
jgi:hypothetical protein